MKPRNLHLKSLLFIVIFFASFARAQDGVSFTPHIWTKGFHLLAGGGVNSTVYTSSSEYLNFGLGLNFKTDLGYYLNDKWAIEAGSMIKFNRVNGYLIWDTLLTLGLRLRMTTWSTSSVYGRAFGGRAPTIIYLQNSAPIEFRTRGVDRIRLDGPLAGLALGILETSLKGTIWFIEAGLTAQFIEVEEGVRSNGQVPEVVYQEALNDNSTIYSLYLSFGILAF